MLFLQDEAGEKPWSRLRNEPHLWYGRFHEFLMQSPPRSLLSIYRSLLARTGANRCGKKPLKQVETIPSSWVKAKEQYHWLARADAYDVDVQARKDAERVAEEARMKAAREAEEAEELRLAAILRKKAEKLLSLLVINAISKHDKEGQIVDMLLVPEFRAFTAASTLLVTAKNHARSGLQMPDKVERSEITGKEGGAVAVKHNDARLTQEERLAQLLALVKQATARQSNEEGTM